ncbi:MAG: UDP-2,3-diacylglucosamine hydrolase [Gammaproteobacteria bacterium]|nr:MAG: UDP-2,3-diacylglucosamine hydrolase [Gammaproteobacteria bacterium]
MKPVVFAADLHLDPARPEAVAAFTAFLTRCRNAQALYLLGDLVEAWIGDDDPAEELAEAFAAVRALRAHGVPVYFIAGNRDFLLGAERAAALGMTRLEEPVRIELDGHPTLLLHGDVLCTDDHAYQALRRQLRDPAWQAAFLARPLAERRAYAAQLRAASRTATQTKAEAIMDVNAQAVAEWMRRHAVDRLIHGHTHRPAVHRFELDGRPVERWVVGDWYRRGTVLIVDAAGWRLEAV